MTVAIARRPTVGRLVVPYMVDATRSPIDFKVLAKHDRPSSGPMNAIGARRIRPPQMPHSVFVAQRSTWSSSADPWMHPDCAELALEQCPFLAGRRDWRAAGGPLLEPYTPGGMVRVLATNWRAHRDGLGAWHFEAITRLAA